VIGSVLGPRLPYVTPGYITNDIVSFLRREGTRGEGNWESTCCQLRIPFAKSSCDTSSKKCRSFSLHSISILDYNIFTELYLEELAAGSWSASRGYRVIVTRSQKFRKFTFLSC